MKPSARPGTPPGRSCRRRSVRSAEQHAKELAASETRHQQIHAALDAANAKLNETTDAHAFEQAAWATTRRELETQANEFKAAAGAQAKTDETLRTTAEALRKTTDAYASDRGAWDAVRRELEADVNRVCAELAKTADARHDEFKTHKLELQKAADARTTLEAQLTKTQAERQQVDDAHAAELKTRERALHDAADARKTLEAALAQAEVERQKAAGRACGRPRELGRHTSSARKGRERCAHGDRRVLGAGFGPPPSPPGIQRARGQSAGVSRCA